MKRKILSLLLAITLIAITVSVAFPATLASETENLFTNGDFVDYSGNIPTSWKFNLKGTTTAELVNDVEVAEGVKVNAMKFTTPETVASSSSTRSSFTYNSTIKIEKNAKYTMSFWVKAKKISGFRAYMFEPKYISKDGKEKTSTQAVEGQNIYTYTSDSGTTRVIRTDIKHSWTVAETGNSIDNSTASMFITRKSGAVQVLTPDYPAAERQDEWLQVIHTFQTGSDDAHEANISYDFHFPQIEGGEIWLADFRMTVFKDDVDCFYTPAVNDDTLGVIAPYGKQPLYAGKEATFTAEPYGENKFDGWYLNDELVSEEENLTFVHDPANPPKYEARFTKATWGVDGSFETGYTKNQLLAQATHATKPGTTGSDWTETSFLNSEKNNSGFVIDSNSGGTWRKATITDSVSHSGKYSALYDGRYGAVGYKYTGLNKNTEYVISAFAYLTPSSGRVDAVAVTGGNNSLVVNRGGTSYTYDTEALYYANTKSDDKVTKDWIKYEITVNTRDNNEIILWMVTSGDNAKLYLDDFAIARTPYKFTPLVNDINLGFVSPAEGITVVEGDEITLTATPLDGNDFEGWYIDDECVSTEFIYTHEFKAETSTKLTAKFKPGKYAIEYAGFENAGYTNGQVMAQKEVVSNYPWTVDSKFTGTWQMVKASTTKTHTGTTSMYLNCHHSLAGFKVQGLEPDTKYAFSFYAYANPSETSRNGISEAFVLPTSTRPVEGTNHVPKSTTLGYLKNFADIEGAWTKVIVEFETDSTTTDVTLWISPNAEGTENPAVHIDNIALYEAISASAIAGIGGNISSNITAGTVALGSKIQLKATPLEGNTFVAWIDSAGNVVSTDATYEFIADEDFVLTATFEGYNKPALDVFANKGEDGTFENGTITGWFADDPAYGHSISWCSWARAKYADAYEGEYALKVSARHRDTILPIRDLARNTNYRFTFYVNQPDADSTVAISSYGIAGGEVDTNWATATNMLTEVNPGTIKGNTGWHRVDLYFNTGDFTSVNFIMRYVTEAMGTYLWMDNISLYQYNASPSLQNSNFSEGKKPWIGEATIANNSASFTEGDTLYQTVMTDSHSKYAVSFKAKGDITAAVQEINAYNLSAKKYINSTSYVTATGNEEKVYTFEFYTGIHKAVNLLFEASGDATISDIKIVKQANSAGANLEYIDFETDRFDLRHSSDSFSIYYANGANDKNVHSGNRSLKFTYNSALANTDVFFNEAFASYMGKGRSWKVTFYYKIANGKDGGSIRLAPEYTGKYGADTGFEHTSANDGWNMITFFFNNSTDASMKLMISSIAASTASDFYIDDISITVAPPLVSETGTKLSFCEALYNVIDNESFESPLSDKDWKGASSKMKIVSGSAHKGSNFLRVSANTHYVLELTVKPDTEYYFGASVRATAATKGYIGVATDPEGKVFYHDFDEKPASLIRPKVGSTDWERSAFCFTTDSSGKAYLVIDVTSGALEIDSVMFFTSEYGYRYDPNDYTIYVPYDYDNLKSSSCVINGGFGAQPYYSESNGAEPETPYTGDTTSITLPVAIIVFATALACALMLVRKRKEGGENA